VLVGTGVKVAVGIGGGVGVGVLVGAGKSQVVSSILFDAACHSDSFPKTSFAFTRA
jgi:hypothetical protein